MPVSSNVRPHTRVVASSLRQMNRIRFQNQCTILMMRRMKSVRIFIILATCALVTSCATPIQQGSANMTVYDRDTEYELTERPGGFALAINYSRYQFIPESSAVAQACKSALTSLAHDLAERKGRRIKPIDEQRVRLSFGRNGFTGVTSCSASAIAEWQ